MGLPCIDDSCNVIATINPLTKHLQLQVKVNPDGGLNEGDDDCAGLRVELLDGNTISSPSDPGNLVARLGLAAGGQLYVNPGRALTENFGGGVDDAGPNPVAARIKHDGTESLTVNAATNPISDNELTNPYPVTALVIVTGTFRLGWTIPLVGTNIKLISNNDASIDYVPYHAKIRAQIIAAIGTVEPTDWPAAIAGSGAAPQRTAFFDVGGMARNDKTPQHLRDWRDFSFALYVPAGEKVFLAAQASHNGDIDIRTFVDTETFPAVAPAFEDRGIRASGEAIWLPLSGTSI